MFFLSSSHLAQKAEPAVSPHGFSCLQIFAAGRKAGWLKEGGPRVDHCPFGLVLGEDGKRIKWVTDTGTL